MKIALLPEYFYPYIGGGENWFREIGSGLVKRGHEIAVFCFPMAGVARSERMDGMLVTRVGVFAIERWQPYLKRIVSHVLSFFSHPVYLRRWDAVIGQGSALLAVFPVLWARRTRIFCVVHDIYGLSESIQDKGLMKGLLRYVFVEQLLHKLPFTGWIAVSETTESKLEKFGVSKERIFVVRNGAKPPDQRTRTKGGRNSIVYIGRLVKHKHVEDLISALSRLDPNLEWKARIAGDGEERSELEALATKLGLQSRIEFLGWISEEEKWDLLFSASCLILPSIAEGWGVVLTEAACAGVPAIAYDVPAVREQAKYIPSVSVVPPREVGKMAEKILYIIRHPAEAERIGRAGQRAAEKFTWQAAVEELESQLTTEIQS